MLGFIFGVLVVGYVGGAYYYEWDWAWPVKLVSNGKGGVG